MGCVLAGLARHPVAGMYRPDEAATATKREQDTAMRTRVYAAGRGSQALVGTSPTEYAVIAAHGPLALVALDGRWAVLFAGEVISIWAHELDARWDYANRCYTLAA